MLCYLLLRPLLSLLFTFILNWSRNCLNFLCNVCSCRGTVWNVSTLSGFISTVWTFLDTFWTPQYLRFFLPRQSEQCMTVSYSKVWPGCLDFHFKPFVNFKKKEIHIDSDVNVIFCQCLIVNHVYGTVEYDMIGFITRCLSHRKVGRDKQWKWTV
jgi:hypothetical protein